MHGLQILEFLSRLKKKNLLEDASYLIHKGYGQEERVQPIVNCVTVLLWSIKSYKLNIWSLVAVSVTW